MTIADLQSSINALCDEIDGLVRVFTHDIRSHQQPDVIESGDALGRYIDVEESALVSAQSLLLAVGNLKSQISGIGEVVEVQERLLTSLHIESRTDGLTGILNRRAFDEELLRRYAQARRSSQRVALLILDIDRFKLVNDTYGHAAGDKILRGVANVLGNTLREMDVVARFGGEEFAAILPDTKLLDACRVAERIRTIVGTSSIQCDNAQVGITVSVGVAAIEKAANETEAAQQADRALYAAKRSGRNQVFVFNEGVCLPLRQNAASGYPAQRRQFMRFLTERFQVRIRSQDGAWHSAEVRDESLDGMCLALATRVNVCRFDRLLIDYCGELRQAQLMNIDSDTQETRLGLQWIDRSWHTEATCSGHGSSGFVSLETAVDACSGPCPCE